jgi:hypothetical protein
LVEKRLGTGARRAASLLCLALVAAVTTPLAAQEDLFQFDVRVGAVYSSPLATGEVQAIEDVGTANRGSVELQPRIGPMVDAALQFVITPYMDGELRLGVSNSGLESTGPAGSWDAGDATTISAAVGLDANLVPSFVFRAGLGTLIYSSGAALFEGGSSTGLMLTGGLGYWLPVNAPFGLRLDGDIQWSGFGSTALRASGAADGAVYRILLGLAATFGGAR